MSEPRRPRLRSREAASEDPSRTGRISLRVEEDEHGQRLDVFLAARLTWRSRTSIEKLIAEGCVELTGRSARRSRRLQEGEEILVELPKPKRDLELEQDGESLPIPLLHEDPWLLVVDKPAGIPVHPGGRLLYNTVITTLAQQYEDATPDGEEPIVPKLCHRLDLETSGVLLVGKQDHVVTEVGRQLRERETVKEYLALVHGRPNEREFLIDEPIGNDELSTINLKRRVRPDGEDARTGVTWVETRADVSLLRIRLHTGRRHQIRVHLHHVGLPIVGDKLYGLDERFFVIWHDGVPDAEMVRQLRILRQALHATRVVLTHPVSGELLEVRSSLPPDLAEFFESLGPAESP